MIPPATSINLHPWLPTHRHSLEPTKGKASEHAATDHRFVERRRRSGLNKLRILRVDLDPFDTGAANHFRRTPA